MKKQIRSSVWETNSSSSHSVSITDKGSIDTTLIADDDGVLRVRPLEFMFGRQWAKYKDAATKLMYAAIFLKKDDSLLWKVVTEQTGASRIEYVVPQENEDNYHFPFIDHQAFDSLDLHTKTEDELRDFIFNTSSWLYIGNDESYPPTNFYDSEDTVYEYSLVCEMFPELSTKFKTFPTLEQIERHFESLKPHLANKEAYDVFAALDGTDSVIPKGTLVLNPNSWSSDDDFFVMVSNYSWRRKVVPNFKTVTYSKLYLYREDFVNRRVRWSRRKKLTTDQLDRGMYDLLRRKRYRFIIPFEIVKN